MATIYITEFGNKGIGSGFADDGLARLPALTEQTVAIGASSAASAAFNAGTKMIRVHTDAACSILVGSGTPTATAAKMRLAAGQTEYFEVTPGHKLAVIQNT